MEDNFFERLEKKLEQPITLIAGIVFLLMVLLPLENLLNNVIQNILIRYVIYFVLFIFWILFWIFNRKHLPYNKTNKVTIVFAIVTETDLQKQRLKNDFFKRIAKTIQTNDLKKYLRVIYLNEFQSIRITNILRDYPEINKIKKKGIKLTREQKRLCNKFKRIQKRLQGNFYVFGNIKERKDSDDNYFFELEALVLHPHLSENVQIKLQKEMSLVWTRNIKFKSSIELKGFEFSADMVLISAEYITGIALLISGHIRLAEIIHLIVENKLQDSNNHLPHLKYMKSELKLLIAEEQSILARFYLSEGNKQECLNYIYKVLARDKNNYSALTCLSVYEFVYNKNPIMSLDAVNKAEKVQYKDNVWRYNKAFLLMYLGYYEKALAVYFSFPANGDSHEDELLNEIIRFNEQYINDNPSFCQSYFILGLLYYTKAHNYPKAYENFNLFKESKCYTKIPFLKEKTNKHLRKLEKEMSLN